MGSILFVCLGNLCRSPMAEAIFSDLLRKHSLSTKIHVDSAGLGHWHVGNPPHEKTCEILSKKNIPYDQIVARQVTKEDLKKFDLIIVMDKRNFEAIRELAGNNAIEVRYLTDFISESDYTEVPDPYHTGDFEETYEIIYAGCHGLLEKILSKEIL